jgi:hypothetical protein
MKKLTINLAANCKATEISPHNTTWDELKITLATVIRQGELNLRDYLAAPDNIKKYNKDGLAWIPCSTIDPNGARIQSNMDKAYALVLDIDTGMPLNEVKEHIEGFEAVIHSSFSHSPEHPKWRVVLPLAEPIEAKDLTKIFDHFQADFDGRLDASCGHDPSRLYYLPACPADAERLFHYEHMDGAFLDVNEVLKAGPPKGSYASTITAEMSMASARLHAGVAEGGRNQAAFKLAASLFGRGVDIAEVTETVLAWNEKNDPPLDVKEVHSVLKSAMKTVATKSEAADSLVGEIVDELNLKYAWVKKLHGVYRFEYKDFAKIDQLRHQYANTGMMVRVGNANKWQTNADIWYRSPIRRCHSDVDFVPGAGLIVDNKINLWQGWGASPIAGDIAPWKALLDFLFAGDPAARKWIEQWLAYPLQNPGAKMTTAVVIWSLTQGVGKSMLGDTVGKLYGKHFKTISAMELHSNFNGWMRDGQFVLGEENSSTDQRADANRLKAMITGDTVFINEKFQPALELPNCANFMFTSNHPDAFHMDDADRRFFVWEIVANRMPNEFYDDFIDWRDQRGGLNALMDHLTKLDLTGFVPKGNAPMTEAKTEMIRHSKSDLERWINDTFEDPASVESALGKQIVTLEELTGTYNRQHGCRANTTAMSRAFRKQHRYQLRKISTRAGRRKLMSVTNHGAWELVDNAEWVVEFEKPMPISLS